MDSVRIIPFEFDIFVASSVDGSVNMTGAHKIDT